MFGRISGTVAFLLVLSICQVQAWGGPNDEPFAFRLNLALDRISVYTDVIGRQASNASPFGSSNNPAAPDFLQDPPFAFTFVAAVDTNQAFFRSGAWIESVVGALAWRPGDIGTFKLIYVRSDTQNGRSNQTGPFGLGEIIIRNDRVGVGYSKKLGSQWSLGGEFVLADSSLEIDGMSSLGAFTVPSTSQTDSVAAEVSVGVMYALNEQWMFGLSGGTGWSRDKTKLTVFAPGPVNIRVKDTTQSTTLRFGAGYHPAQWLGFFGDLQYVHLDSDLGNAETLRGLVGVEIYTPQKLAFRAGLSLDTDTNVVYSAGMGYYGLDHVFFELAYRYNAFPEVNREMGRASLVSISAGLSF